MECSLPLKTPKYPYSFHLDCLSGMWTKASGTSVAKSKSRWPPLFRSFANIWRTWTICNMIDWKKRQTNHWGSVWASGRVWLCVSELSVLFIFFFALHWLYSSGLEQKTFSGCLPKIFARKLQTKDNKSGQRPAELGEKHFHFFYLYIFT